MAEGRLSARGVETARHPGTPNRPVKLADGNGLFLQITPSQTKSWLLRYTLAGRTREMGLGAAGKPPLGVSLADARRAVAAARVLASKGVDPINHRETAKREEAAARVKAAAHTFRSVADEMLEMKEGGWRNAKHRQQWRNTLASYAFPVLGDMPVSSVTTDDVLNVLRPIWLIKPETASRVRGRIERVMAFAKATGRFKGDNPATWRGHLAETLPSPRRVQGREPGNHAALPWDQVASFMVDLRSRQAISALALEFLILTACRTTEVLQARWGEIDVEAGTWTIPATRMKAKREHRVALSGAAKAVLASLANAGTEPSTYVFHGNGDRTCLSSMSLLMLLRRMNPEAEGKPARWRDARSGAAITAHGFRSTFRDWAGEHSNHSTAVAEAALAHTVRDKTEAAYARGDLFEKRRVMMEDWAAFTSAPPASGQKGGRKNQAATT